MYQHDIKEARLAKTLNDIVTECVSFVGKKLCRVLVLIRFQLTGAPKALK